MKLLISKFVSNTISEEELQELKLWLENKSNRKLLEDYIKDAHDLNLALLEPDINAAYKKVSQQILRQEKTVRNHKVKKLITYSSIAAAFLIGAIWIYKNQQSPQNTRETIVDVVDTKIEAGSNKATLTLEDGKHISLEKGNSYQNKNAVSNGEQLVYNKSSKSATVEKEEFNYLTIPRGGEFFMELSDGTKVWVNSESKLKYPVKFIPGKTRKVELIYGEAYLEVSPSTNHSGDKFVLQSPHQEIKVLGTAFNVKAYKEDLIIETTLVEGKISSKVNHQEQILMPSQQLTISTSDQTTQLKTVRTDYVTAWTKGYFKFKSKPLKKIMTVLSRWYDIEVVFEDKKAEQMLFNGTLSKRLNIQKILTTLENTHGIKCQIEGRKISIKEL